ncbi:amidase family protein [Brevibacillus reuszeri]|uniref:amidase family protein n=1 Tax=Brevibacillus reuszeri TaxID=54915 RepID=UPI002896FB11|nr:amidase family protein [Brevibacillus reuszeri]
MEAKRNSWIMEADISSLQAAMEAGTLSSEHIIEAYLERIKQLDGLLRSIIEINPEAPAIAKALDAERALKGSRGPLHGIPILLKDNIETGDQLHTSAGSVALAEWNAPEDSAVAKQLRSAGAVLLGKANMTEWANIMSSQMWAGYSSRGGLTLNPYGPGELFVGGSSSGSAAAVAANLVTAAIGTETSGSIISPASQNGIVGLKPTVGLVSQSGIIPLTRSQDSAGPMTRTVQDAAIVLGALNEAGIDYTTFLEEGFLQQARIGIPRFYMKHLDEDRLRIVEEAIDVLREKGATIIDPVTLPCEHIKWDWNVLRYEFKCYVNVYLATLPETVPVRSLQDVIIYNEKHAEIALKYGQDKLIWCEQTSGTLTEADYVESLQQNKEMAGKQGIDHALYEHRLDALLFLGNEGGPDLAARVGYPVITVPGGYAENGVIAPGGYITKGPQGITFVGTANSEPTLFKIAFGYEQATKHRISPVLMKRLDHLNTI